MLDSSPWTEYDSSFQVTEDGSHAVVFYSVDVAGNIEEEQSCEFTIHHALPLEVSITGGLGVSLQVTNTGTSTYTNVPWSISLQGGLLLSANQSSGSFLQLPSGLQATKKLPILGIGKTTIIVSVDGITTSTPAFLFFVFVLGLS